MSANQREEQRAMNSGHVPVPDPIGWDECVQCDKLIWFRCNRGAWVTMVTGDAVCEPQAEVSP